MIRAAWTCQIGLAGALAAAALPAAAQSWPGRSPAAERVQRSFHATTEDIRRELERREREIEQRQQEVMRSVCPECSGEFRPERPERPEQAAAAAPYPVPRPPGLGAPAGQ